MPDLVFDFFCFDPSNFGVVSAFAGQPTFLAQDGLQTAMAVSNSHILRLNFMKLALFQ